jgi:membrane-associated phospholipid phosphatase
MYRFILLLAVIVLTALWFSNQPSNVIIGSLVLIQLLLLAFFINCKTKISLHVAIAVYTGFGLWEINREFSMVIWAVTPLIAWSRWYLGRHLAIELFLGLVLGCLCGIEILYFI